MSKFDEQLEKELAKLEEQKKKKKKTTDIVKDRLSYLPSSDDDIGPVHSGGGGKIEPKTGNKDLFGLDLVQKGAFNDGYDFGDITKTILGTAGDVVLGAVKGAANTVGGVIDLAQYGVAGVADLLGADDFAKQQRQWANKDVVNSATKDAEEWLDDYSILGNTSTAITEGLGQVGTTILTGGLGKAAGLGNAGVTALTSGSMFASGMGSGMSEAYNEGATDGEALTYGTISGAADALSEMLFGGLGKGLNATGFNKGLLNADDLLAKKVSGLFKKQLTKNLAEYGIKAGAEGFEEVIAGIAQAGGKKLTYMSEEDFSKILEDENLLEQFVVGSVVSGIAQAKGVKVANDTKTDFVTGRTQNEQAVIEREVENRIAEMEADGTKLTNKQKAAIEVEVEKDLEKGYISTDTIEEVLGGTDYMQWKNDSDFAGNLQQEYDDLSKEYDELYSMKNSDKSNKQIDREAELKNLLPQRKSRLDEINSKSNLAQTREQISQKVYETAKNDRLVESYNEKARRTQTYEADLSKYDEKQKAVIQKAIDSGVLNNTNRTHAFVDMVAKISADKGVLFDFTTNQKLRESGFAMEGVTQNGFVNKNGDITVNLNAAESLNYVVGHEITHVLEGTELYNELQNAVKEYATTKGEYDSRLESLTALYAKYDPNADPVKELTADLVGKYLFTDEDFINNLSTNHRNVFQKVYDEIKYLLKVATAGSKEARQLEKAKRSFEKAYRENTKADAKTEVKTEGESMIDPENDADLDYESPMKYSMTVTDPETIDFLENQEHITTYKAMVLIDGKLYPPMASKVKGEDGKYRMTNPRDLGEWQQATEDTTNIKFNDKGIGYYDLKKDDGGTVRAAYNPYEHSSNLVLNDQFEAAYKRDNLVTVECEIPVSEMSSGYKAEHAKDPVGMMDWHSGVVAGKLKDNKRMVYLSRYLKAVRILSDAETAVKFKEIVGDTPVPFNVVSPGLLAELEKIGVNIDYNGSPQYQYLQRKAAEREAKKNVKFSLTSDSQGRQLSQEQQEYFKDSAIRDKNGSLMVLYHGTQNAFTVFDISRSGENYDGWSEYGEGIYLTPEKKTAQYYGDNAGRGREVNLMEVYADIKNPFSTNDPVDFDISDLTQKYELTEFDERFMKKYGSRLIEFLNHHNESVRDYLTGKGFDGVWETIDGDVYQVIAYAENQVKNTDNTKPTENPDIRYSLSVDSDGNRLTEEQDRYFRSSKMRDDNGNLKVMYHGSQNGGFHTFDPNYSDDGASFFFVDRNTVATSYSGTSETYAAQTFKTADDFNKFFAEIGAEEYEVKEVDGKFHLYEDGDLVAVSGTAEETYEEFRDWSGLGYGNVNYKVYLDLVNPFVFDAKGAEWNGLPNIQGEDAKYEYIKLLSYNPDNNAYTIEYAMTGDPAPQTKEAVPFADLDDGISTQLENLELGEELRDVPVKPNTTRDYAEYARKNGYDGVILKNIVDVGGYGGDYAPATVAIAFDGSQVKSVANQNPTTNKDIRYSLSEDSNGRKLSPEQSEYFKDSKVKNENGNLMVMYHGTPNGDFTVFKDGTYFTSNKEYADVYRNPGASSISTSKTASNPKTFEVYLNIKKPFDINDAEARRIYIDEYIKGGNAMGINPYLSDAEYAKIRTIDWTEGEDLREFLIENEYDYDGLILDEGATGGYSDEVKSRGQSYVVFNPEQVKNVDNQNPTSDPDIRFSLTEYTAEEKKEHNKAVLEHFGKTYKWAETGYLLLDGSKLDLSGKHEGAPGGYRTVDHRDIVDALGDEYGDDTYSGSLVQFMSEGNIRIIPECNGINLSVKPTKAQEQALSDFVSRVRGEVILDIDNLNGQTVESVEYPRGTHANKVLNDIREWFDNGKRIEIPGGSQFLYSLSERRELMHGRRGTYGSDIALPSALEDIAPVAQKKQTVKPVKEPAILGTPATEEEVSAMGSEMLQYALDEDAPPEIDAPYFEDTQAEVEDPFEDRDWFEVSRNRKTPAYMYENPEVKPFFQEEAQNMLGELTNTIRGERFWTEEGGYSGVSRMTSKSIETLLDEWKMSYADIEKGLEAIIKDNGAENIAAAKKIEFMLNDRLLNGYEDFYTKQQIPPSQEYIQALEEKQITEYHQEAFERLMANPEQFAPYEEDPAEVVRETKATEDIGPLYDAAPRKGVLEGQQSMMKEEQPVVQEETEEETQLTRKELHKTIIDRLKSVFQRKGYDLDHVLKHAKNLSTFATVDNTPQRVMDKALGYKPGEILADETVNKVAQNESEGIKWLNGFTDRKNGILAQISRQYQIKPGSKESAAAQMYAEGFWVNQVNDIVKYGDAELFKDFRDPDVRRRIKGLANDPRIRQIYDETLNAINESRTRNAYPEIPRLDNYFLHFRAMNDTFSKLGLPFNPNDIRAKDLPTDLNGVTADLKPGQPFFASAMHRKGIRTSFDLLGGLEQYLTSAKNQIYHIDDIQTLRALRNYIADTWGQANGLEGLDVLSEEEAQERIKEVYNSHLSTFAKFLNEEANILAGKTSLIDRGIEGIIGRRGMTTFDNINRQVGANMVGYNVSSSLTNFLAPVQAFAKMNKSSFVKGFAQTVSNRFASIAGKGDGFAEQSPVMIRRRGADRFHRTLWQKMSDPGYALMGAVDNISTEIIARAKYNELTKKGMDSQQAHFETDKWVSRLMGDRSLGQQPQIFNSKMLGLVTKFQLEVRNQLDSQFYDTIQEAKVSNEHIQNGLARNAKTAAKIVTTFVELAVVQHLFGKAFESIAGYNPAFDIISAIATAFGWDDEEDSEDTAFDNIEQGLNEFLEDMPYASVLMDGGRIPISSALPIGEFIKGEDQYGNEKSRWKIAGEAAPYYFLPGGYGQIKKTAAGLGMFSDEHPIAGSYTNSGNLRFPVEDTTANRVQAAIFGQYASSNARDYFDNERSALKPKQVQELVDTGMSIHDYWEYRDGLKAFDSLEEKMDYINSLNLTTAQKNILVNNIADRKEEIDISDYDDYGSLEEFDYANKNPEKYAFFDKLGIDYNTYKNADEDAKKAYDWAYENPEKYSLSKAVADDVVEYRSYTKALYDIKADKDSSGKSISGSRKEKVANYINSLDMDYGEKIILFKSEYEADDTYNEEIIDYLNNRSDITYAEMVEILKQLGFTVTNDGNVYWD